MNVLNKLFLLLFLLSFNAAFSQITVDNDAPFDDEVFLIDNVLLGGGIDASNHQYSGDEVQIGFFDGTLCNIGLDGGIVMSTGDINDLVPFGPPGVNPNNNVNDPDLLTVAQSVPGLIGENFIVNSVNDVAILEFDFVPTSSFLTFNYAFGSQEYFSYENTQFNDVFGFFISGPGIVGPYASPAGFPDGSINIATFESQEANSLGVDLPITISSICDDFPNVYNPQLFNSNLNGLTIDGINGFTTVLTAQANVICGETYHIRLSIADGSDGALNSYVFLDAGSFVSPPLQVTNSLDIDSLIVFADCGTNVDLLIENPSEDLTYLWNTGEFGSQITVGPGAYWVSSSDSLNCTVNSDTIYVYSLPTPSIAMPLVNEFCSEDIYTISPNVTDGTEPYFYSWQNGGDLQHLDVTDAGTYQLTVTDVNGCTDVATVDVIQNPLPVLTYEPLDILICGGSPVEVTAVGASSYQWSPNSGISAVTGDVVDLFSTSSITYILEGTDDNGCSSTVLIPTTVANGFEVDVFSTPVTCPGEEDGSLTLIAGEGAVYPLSYSVDDGDTYFSYVSFDNLEYGDYTIAVQDALGCVIREDVEIGSSAEPIQVVTSASSVMCSGELGGLSVVSVLGGNIASGDYQYNWYSSQSNDLVGTSASINVPEGGYFLEVKDDNNCIGSDQAFVQDFSPLEYTVSTTDVSCLGVGDGSISVNVTGGGVAPYTYNWINYAGSTFSTLVNLGAGTYNLEVTDGNGCVTPISVTLSQPSTLLSAELTSSEVSCFGNASGFASLEVTGGNQPYSYSWSSGHVTSTASQLVAGDYDVTVTDASGCSLTKSMSLTQNPEISVVTTSESTSCFSSNDGSASVVASGGTGLLTYNWSSGDQTSTIVNQTYGDYLVVVEDEIGCIVVDTAFIDRAESIRVKLNVTDVLCYGDSTASISSIVIGGTPYLNGTYSYSWLLDEQAIGFNASFINNLPQQDIPYELIVTDLNGCFSNAFAFVGQPESLRLDTSELVPAYCGNIPTGSVSVNGLGGFLNTGGSYQYTWEDGTDGPVLANQNSGEYTVSIKDDNDCEHSMTLDIPLEETFFSSMATDPLNCYEDESGTATVTTVGGYGPYTYNWNWPSGSEQLTHPSQINMKANLPFGVSSVIVEDANGCVITDQVQVLQPAPLLYTVVKDNDESCSGDVSACDGQFTLSATGGTGDYTFKWLNISTDVEAGITVSGSATASGLCAGFYDFIVTDERSCVASPSGSGLSTPEIVAGFGVNSTIDISSIVNEVVCYGDTALSASVYNPNANFSYTWYVNGQAYSNGLSALMTADSISVQATYGVCSSQSDIYVGVQPDPVAIVSDVTPASCFGLSTGSVEVDAIDSQGFTYLWSNGLVAPSISSLEAGLYTLSITNTIGCVSDFEFEVTEPLGIEVTSNISNTLCNDGEDGAISLSIDGGTAPYSLDWQGVDPNTLSAGTYSVVITDVNGCDVIETISVGEPTAINASFDASQIPFVASVSGGSPLSGYSYSWLYYGNAIDGANSQEYTPTQDGLYSLVVRDANNCEVRVDEEYNFTTSLSDLDALNFNIYPNPMNDYLMVEVVGLESSTEYSLKMLDNRGRVVRELNFRKQVKINREGLANGIYMLQIQSDKSVLNYKLLIDG